jgi:hypothetical protein
VRVKPIPINHVASPLQTEALAIREGIMFALGNNWMYVEFDSDCSTLVKKVNHGGNNTSEVGRIVDESLPYYPNIVVYKCVAYCSLS